MTDISKYRNVSLTKETYSTLEKLSKAYKEYSNVAQDFCYRSDTNSEWVSQDDLRDILKEEKCKKSPTAISA